jgi:hypothetical protein
MRFGELVDSDLDITAESIDGLDKPAEDEEFSGRAL